MSFPHPLDNEWRKCRNYFKLWYDVKNPITGEIIQHCWPNAGRIDQYECGEVEMRISHFHPMGGIQVTQDTMDRVNAMYGPHTETKV